ncbi:MAG: tyrosine--tRNA ligase [Nitrospinae bacterium]|nr:tyrosine--tRNA ligase [Nitrospinota bacterium]
MSSVEKDIDKQLALIAKGTEEILPENSLRKKLLKSIEKNKPLVVKAGFDPTAPDLHLGHTVLIQKMRDFQNLGHQVVFLIGDYTAKIGDPTGRNEARKVPTDEEIQENLKTYQRQVFKILDEEKTKVVFNRECFSKFTAADLISLASKFTFSQLLQRDDFTKRFKENLPIHLHEFMYPLVQGYDSVALNADIELGGTDQKFNLLLAREAQKLFGKELQVIITMPILEGLDGEKKMSKSLGNYIGIDEDPREIFGKIMSIPDDLMYKYYLLLTDRGQDEVDAIKKKVKKGELHPKEAKTILGKEIVARYHSEEEAIKSAEEFNAVFKDKGLPDDMPEAIVSAANSERLVNIAAQSFNDTTSNIRRLIKQQAVSIDGNKVSDENLEMTTSGEFIAKFGKRRFLKIVVT